MSYQNSIVIQGLCQNNLKNISLEIPKGKIVVFTGVSGSGKSSIVFDTIAAESQRQMNETYSAFVRGRLPKFEKPRADKIENLSASVVIDQTSLGGNARSTVGTISDMYAALRLLYSRIGEPHIGTPSYFSFNDPNGMCPECSGIGKVMTLDILPLIAEDKSLNEGMVDLPTFHVGNWYWKQYTESGLFDLDKKWRDYSAKERNLLLYGAEEPGGDRVSKQVEGIHNMMSRLLLKRDSSEMGETSAKRLASYVHPSECPLCHGKRLNATALSCKVAGYSINELCEMELTELRNVLGTITDPQGKSIADNLALTLTHMIDIGPLAGRNGGEVLYQGSYEGLLGSGTLTGNTMQQKTPVKAVPRKPKEFLPLRNAAIYNLKNISVDIPRHVLTAVTGVAGSGKSSLIRDVFAEKYAEQVIFVDQPPVTATGRSTPATFLEFFDEIRKRMGKENDVGAALFSFNSKGACPNCKGKGIITTELVFMDPVTTTCEACGGSRYSDEALSYTYHGKNIVEILDMNAGEAETFFSGCPKIRKALHAMVEVGLSYLSLGQPLSTLSGGERQRVKMAKYLDQKGNIYVLDESTTGLHASDIKKVMELLDGFVKRGNTVIVIEHNMDVVKLADYVIDIGPDGGSMGGEIVFTGTPQEMADHADTITAKYLRKSLEG